MVSAYRSSQPFRSASSLQALHARSAHDDVVVHCDAQGCAIVMMALVIVISACDGVGSPEGWLWTTRESRIMI